MEQISRSGNGEDKMTFQEWWNKEDRMHLSNTSKVVAEHAWIQQQKRLDFFETMTENQQLIIANLHEELALADNRPMVKSDYFERIEELEKQVEWHKRRAEGWRSIAVLEAQEKNT